MAAWHHAAGAIALLAAALPAAHAASTRDTVGFHIERAWFDDDTVYVKYRRNVIQKAAFSTSLRGKVTGITDTRHLITLPRAALSATDATLLRLDGGEPADGLEYRDRDITVTRHADTVTVQGREVKSELTGCVPSQWWDLGLARSGSGLFVCGAFVGTSGRVEWQLAPATVASLQASLGELNQRGPNAAANAFPVLAATFSGPRVMVTTDWTAVQPAEVRVATVDAAQPDVPSFATSGMASAAGYFGLMHGRPAYSPAAGFVINNGSKDKPRYTVCDATRCTPLPLTTRHAYLLVDDRQRVAYAFTQANTSVQDVRVSRIAW